MNAAEVYAITYYNIVNRPLTLYEMDVLNLYIDYLDEEIVILREGYEFEDEKYFNPRNFI